MPKRETRNQKIVQLFKEGKSIGYLAFRFINEIPFNSLLAHEKVEAIIRKALR